MTEGLKFLLGFAIVAFIPVAWVIGDELSIKISVRKFKRCIE